jgi:hypothetical protein
MSIINIRKIGFVASSLTFTLCVSQAVAQTPTPISRSMLAGQQNVITTAVPFLTITPDSRRAGMGDAGVASSADANSVFWNAASLAFADKKSGAAISYAPWLRALVPGISYNYLAGYTKIRSNQRSVIGGSFRFFTFGEINFTDDIGNPLGTFKPSEYAVDICYATQLSKHWAIGTTLKYINSNLAGTRPLNGITPKVGRSGAGDISALYKGSLKAKIKGEKKDIRYSVGINLQNLGAKITYSDKTNKEYIPANLKIGTSWSYDIDQYNSITGMFDLNKLMVPTPGITVLQDYTGLKDSLVLGTEERIFERNRSDEPVILAAIKSFADAPGGLKEELKEYNVSLGLEYIYAKQFFLRAGYFNEAKTKGNRKYATFGFGIRYKVFGLDAAYLVPFVQRHPLQNQLRFTLIFDLDAALEENKK